MKASVTVEFSLGTSIEAEVNDYHFDNGQITDFQGESYWSSEEITVSGGGFTFTCEDDSFTDEDDITEWVKAQVIDDGNEVEDANGITWIVEELDISVEIEELPLPTYEEALVTLGEFAESKRNDEEWGEVARAAVVVLDTLGTVEARVSNLEAQVASLIEAAKQTGETQHPF